MFDALMSMRQYLELPGYGSSDLTTFRNGPPALVKYRREHREESDTEATRIGHAAHCRILTPDLFDSTYAVKPEGMTFASNIGKEWRDAQKGREILTFNEARDVQGAYEAFMGREPARKALQRATEVEVTLTWECKVSGLSRKARPDWFIDGEHVYDLKVSVEAMKDKRVLVNRCYSNGWIHQLANNRVALNENGCDIRGGRLVVVAPKPPHDLFVWMLEVRENDLDLLELENEKAAKGLAECVRRNEWPMTPDEWIRIDLPAWAEPFTDSEVEEVSEVQHG